MAIASIPVYLVRIAREERMMVSSFGEAYLRYREKTKTLIPYIY
jgi:protein-S-isoprenylcysteine O-methyltransferase Ste14